MSGSGAGVSGSETRRGGDWTSLLDKNSVTELLTGPVGNHSNAAFKRLMRRDRDPPAISASGLRASL